MQDKYLWLINLLEKYGKLTFADIASYWRIAPCNKDHSELSDRTFRNWRKQIVEKFGISISNYSNRYYSVTNVPQSKLGERVFMRMKEAVALNEVAAKDGEQKCRILLEERPLCYDFLSQIIEAMKENRLMKMSYGNKTKNEYIHPFRCAPLCIKEYQRRFYVLMKWVDSAPSPKEATPYGNFGKLRLYAIDKIDTLETLDTGFDYPKDFDPEKYFANQYGSQISFGKFYSFNVKVPTDKCELLDKYPLHESQKKYYIEDDISFYNFSCPITKEFYLDLIHACHEAEMRGEYAKDLIFDYGYEIYLNCLSEEERERELNSEIY